MLTTLLFLIAIPTAAFPECSAPSNPGVRICSPTAGATVVYIPTVDFNTTPAFGTQISKYIIYDNNQKIAQSSPGQTGDSFAGLQFENGINNVVINAWDTAGNLYQGKVSFRVTDQTFTLTCPIPSSVGVNFCSPPEGAVLSTIPELNAAAKGFSRITMIKLYIDGVERTSRPNSAHFDTGTALGDLYVGGTQGDHTATFVAWDSGGHVFKSSRVLHASYKYGFQDCTVPSQPCDPGVDAASTPMPNAYVDNSFTINADIQQNPKPITTMKAYLDGKVVATSHGPTLISNVENAPSGTHVLTLQGWDNTGIVYRVTYNININVPHCNTQGRLVRFLAKVS
ncbi:MAG TPA: hypothetical protein VLK33_09300 [Terriglobales bacterium]|nr:hypothetical protein [Terriglobales bacterium]